MPETREGLDSGHFLGLHDTKNKLKFLVKLASLAPSSHNTQPWLFRIRELQVEVLPNPNRRLLASDPHDRQFYLSIGAAIENLFLASQALGLEFEVQEGNPGVCAKLTYRYLEPKNIDHKTLRAILTRHNNRHPFADTPLSPKFFEKIKQLCGDQLVATIVTDPPTKKKIQAIVEDATEDAFCDKGFTTELAQWIKPSLKKYRDGMIGYNLGVPYPMSFVLPWMIGHLNLSKSQRKMVTPQLEHAAAYVILSSNEDNVETWLRVGRCFERIAIEAEKSGIKIGLLTAPIEIKNHYQSFQQLLGITTRPQMFFRMGYTDKIPPFSPRLNLDEILV